MADIFEHLAEAGNPEQYIEDTAPWVYYANQHYLDYVFGGKEAALPVVRKWMHRTDSEVSIRNVYLFRREGIVMGGFLGMPGKQLVRARKADTLAVLRDRELPDRDGVIQRMRNCSHLFKYPREDEYYPSKMGVLPAGRGQGLGKLIFGMGLDAAGKLGFRKFRGDVHVDNEVALKMYYNFGWVVDERRESEESGLTYVSMTLQREPC